MTLSLQCIRIDYDTYTRCGYKDAVVDEYAQSLLDGATFPPIAVFFDGQSYWLADGLHRLYASREAVKGEIEADVRKGTKRDAVLYGVGANLEHGLRRTNRDKRRAVTVLLMDCEWKLWSNLEIARRCRVTDTFVGKVRKQLSPNDSEKKRKFKRDEKTHEMDIENIGGNKSESTEGQVEQEPPSDTPPEVSSRSNDVFRSIVIASLWDCLTPQEIEALPVSDLAAPSTLLWLWTPNAHLPAALGMLNKWGFQYADMLTWAHIVWKSKKNCMVTDNCEHCLIAVRGARLAPLRKKVLYAAYTADLGTLSIFHEMVEGECETPKLALGFQNGRHDWASFTFEQVRAWSRAA
jgi:hypothetical protein